MKHKTILAFSAIATFLVSISSCTNNYFDQGRYEELVTSTFPVADIDSLHDWNLLTTVIATIDLSSAPSAGYVVDIYDKNPSDASAYKLATGGVNGNAVLNFNLPRDSKMTQLYVTATGGGKRVVDSYFPLYDNIMFVSPNGKPAEASANPKAPVMEYTYCFEETFPEGGDFDFNDCVMGVSMEKSPKEQNGKADYLDITIRLRAVGGYKTIAASMRLANISPAMVSDTFAITRKGWDFFQYAVDYLEDPQGVMKQSRTSDVRIDLFNDAHFAINGGKLDESGTMVPHPCINTNAETTNPSLEKAGPRTSTYRIEFKDKEAFNSFTFSDLDLFIITGYNANYYETHTVPFFGLQVLKTYPTNINYVPWALVIPDVFQYPVEGMQICKYSSGLNYYEGAYQLGQYSFGAWARDRNNISARSWYRFPQAKMVYPLN